MLPSPEVLRQERESVAAEAKIQDHTEVDRWIREGLTYKQMAEIYRERGIEIGQGAFAMYALRSAKHEARLPRHRDLIPWALEKQHRHKMDVQMLRAESRRRRGEDLPAVTARKLGAWTRRLQDENAVIHYDPGTEQGFFWIPREPQDDDIIRRPADRIQLVPPIE
jgi:hypothetical protein